MNAFQRVSVGLLLLGGTAAAQAVPVNYSVTDPNGSAGAGDITSINTTYDSATGQFSWSYDITKNAPNANDAFWLVVSDGPNPKNRRDQLGILYGDFTTGTNLLTAYTYNGLNSNNSYTDPGTNLGQWEGEINVADHGDSQTVSFSVNVGSINSQSPVPNSQYPWEGIQFGSQIGIWFHPSAGSRIDYDSNGDILQDVIDNYGRTTYRGYSYSSQGYHDIGYGDTTPVPEPAGIALFAAGILGFGCAKRLRSRSV